ncbi:MAG: hypothetical protein QM796_11255 [Chthoniobacteraceae bacterium]
MHASDLILFVVDAQDGITPVDQEDSRASCAARTARSCWWPTRLTTTATPAMPRNFPGSAFPT